MRINQVVNSNHPTYDDDGNMMTNGGWTYTWNGENRMVQAVNGNTKLQFVYDYMGRRIEKKVFDGDTVVSHKRFVYDNYKQVEELDALNSNSVLKRYSWQPEAVGLDVPLSMTDVATAKNYAYTLDANKNVSDLTDAQGNVVAHYEYSPFGTHTATGSYTGNPFRFSSEVFDSETGLIYYNYRYYNPNLGRWINRDPIEEEGGWSLYVMVGNNTSNHWDFLGNGSYGERQRRQAGQNYVNQGRGRNPSPLNPPSGSNGLGGLIELLDTVIPFLIKIGNANIIKQAKSACKKKCKPGSCDYCCGILFRYIRVRYDLESIMSFSVTLYKGKCNNSYIYAYEPGISTGILNEPMKCQN